MNENRIVTMEFSNSEDSKSNMQYISSITNRKNHFKYR